MKNVINRNQINKNPGMAREKVRKPCLPNRSYTINSHEIELAHIFRSISKSSCRLRPELAPELDRTGAPETHLANKMREMFPARKP
jgi:hypothetical protein